MLSNTLAGAVITAPYRGRSEMLRKARQYRSSSRRLRDEGDTTAAALHKELYIVHRSLAQGKRLLSVNKAMEIGGCKPNGYPTLAIGNAAARWVWFVRDAERILDLDQMWNHPTSAFVSTRAANPGWDKKESIPYYDKGQVFRFVQKHFPVRMSEERIAARVPVVPADLLPPGKLDRYCILWEADWQRAPKDPFLLKRITREWYEIIAEWNLTSIERLVAEMAAFAGE